MSSIAIIFAEVIAGERRHRWRLAISEEVILALVLAIMVLLPAGEIALRVLGKGGISGSATIVQHGTLVVSMAGAAIAARNGRLLSMGMATLLPERLKRVAARIASIGGAAVAAVLSVAAFRFVMTERSGERLIAWDIPVWLVASVLPIGFALIALRLIATAQGWRDRVIVGTVALAIAGGTMAIEEASPVLIAGGIGGVILIAIAGAPIFAVIGGGALVGYVATAIPIAAMTVSHYAVVVNPSLPAVPLFTLAGYILAEGGASRRLVGVFASLVGGVRGGPALVTILACAFFTTLTGGSGVTILALGGLLLPILQQARYSERNALGLLTGAGSLGILFPPCLPLILYAIAASVDVYSLFLAGMIPGTLLLALTAWLGWVQQPPDGSEQRFDIREAGRALWEAKWEMLLPVIVLAVLFGGIATPVEAAAITVLYAVVVEVVLHRDYRPSQLLQVIRDCGLLVGGVLLILGVALGLTGFLVDAEVPQHAVDWVTASVHSKVLFLLLLNAFLIVVGALMDIYSAIVVVVPLIVPLGLAFGIDPLHLGIIFLTNLELGYLVPPVGENLFIAAYRFNKPIGELARAVLPMVAVLIVGVLLVTYIPALSLWLVRLR